MTPVRRALAFGVTFMAVSMVIEVVLLVVVRLRIPQDNVIIAPILLLLSPLAAAAICGYRRPGSLVGLALATVVLTVALVMVFGRITGISTGLAAPILIRTLAGFLAVAVTGAASRRRARAGNEAEGRP